MQYNDTDYKYVANNLIQLLQGMQILNVVFRIISFFIMFCVFI